jgi:hypothetical protein
VSRTLRVLTPEGGIEYLSGVTGLTTREAYPGGQMTASFTIPGDRRFPEFSRLTVSKGPVILFDGQIRDRGLTTGQGGKTTQVTAYGHNVLLTDKPYGPRIFADTRIDKWQLYTAINAPMPTTDHAPDKFGSKQDNRSFRLFAKPGAVFRSLDHEHFFYALPKVGGVYVPESIDQITFDYAASFPTGSWALVAWFWDGTQVGVKQIWPRIAGLFAQEGDPEPPPTTGTVTRVAGQKTLAGTATSFTDDLIGKVIAVASPALTLTGTVNKVAAQGGLEGAGTAFSSQVQVNDLIEVGGEIRRVNGVPSNTHLSVDAAWASSGTGLTAYRQQTEEHRRVVSVASATSLTVDEAWLLSATGQSFWLVTQPGLVTSSQMGLPGGCKAAGFALQARASQASWPGFADDGEGKSAIHDLEYAGEWRPDFNDGAVNGGAPTKYWHNRGGMMTADTASLVALDKSGQSFYPDGATRAGGAARLRFTGGKIEWYAQRWGNFGATEAILWSGATAVRSWMTGGDEAPIDLYLSLPLTGTVAKVPWPASGATLSEDLDTSETAVDVSNGALFSLNQIIRIDDEQMVIGGIAGNTLTVTRGYNGATISTHTNGTGITYDNGLNVVGTGTQFLSEIQVGDSITIPGGGDDESRRVTAVLTDELLTVHARFGNTAPTETATRRGWQRKVLDSDFRSSGATLSETLDKVETGIDVSNGAAFVVGQTILIDAERMFVSAIASNTLTVTRGITGTTAATHASGAAISLFNPIIGQFGTYVLTLRNLGTSPSGPPLTDVSKYYTNIDYFKVGVESMKPFSEGDIYAEISDVRITTDATASPDDLTAETVARDIVAAYSGADIGLSPSTLYINQGGADLPVTDHLAFDDPITAIDALEEVIALGTTDDRPLGWEVRGPYLHLKTYPTTAADGWYEVSPDEVELTQDESIQQDFALAVAPTYKDQNGAQQIGPDVESTRVRSNARTRRIILPTDAKSAADAAEIAATYVRTHDRPSQRTRLARVRGYVRDQGGALVPVEDIRAGRMLRLTGFNETPYFNSTDRRSGRDALIVEVEIDHEAGTATLALGAPPPELDLMLARLERNANRERIRA